MTPEEFHRDIGTNQQVTQQPTDDVGFLYTNLRLAELQGKPRLQK